MRRRLQIEELDARIVPTFLGNQVFPLDNPWNQIIADAPVASNSNAIINAIVARHNGTAPKLHADFGNPLDGNLYGIPVNVVDSSTPKVTVVIPNFGYPDESDIVQVPIPANAVIEGDGPTSPSQPEDRGDSHLLVYDSDANLLYELYQAVRPTEDVFPYGGEHELGEWGAWQISFWDLNDNSFRTIGATSADAAGLPIMPGLVRPDEANSVADGGVGVIDHAIRMTVQQTRDEFVFPASHEASNRSESNLPRMGERFRLKANFVIPADWSSEAKAIAQAMKTYGMIVADNGSDMYFQGMPSEDWDMEAVLDIQSIKATEFEVVDLTPRVTSLSVASASTAGGREVTINGKNFGGAAGELHVLFGDVEAASFTILSDTQILAIAPAHAAGTVDVRVQSGTTRLDTDNDPVFFGYGTSQVISAVRFTFGLLPTANADSFSVRHERTLTIGAGAGLRVNDTSNPLGRPLTVALESGPAHGTLKLNANGSFTYKPTAGYAGPDSFTYRAKDGLLASDPATVSIAVTDQAPVATNDSYSTNKGKALSVAAAGILKNDTDADADKLTAILVNGPANGILALKANGSFKYTPNAGFSGADTFTYRANDKALDSGVASVTINVVPPPQVTSVSINDGTAQRSLIRSITITFDTLVTFDSGAFRLTRQGGGSPTITRQISEVNGQTQVVLTFSGSGTNAGSLVDGNWTLKVVKSRVHNAGHRPAIMVADAPNAFHRLFGDSDGDRDVDGTDQTAFNSALGLTDNVSLATFDYDHDGDVDASDQTQFSLRFGATI